MQFLPLKQCTTLFSCTFVVNSIPASYILIQHIDWMESGMQHCCWKSVDVSHTRRGCVTGASIAQWLEHWSCKGVVSSILTGGCPVIFWSAAWGLDYKARFGEDVWTLPYHPRWHNHFAGKASRRFLSIYIYIFWTFSAVFLHMNCCLGLRL